MENLFAGPGFLIVGAALVSVPIIIHLINRMRFKRIRWAAMEFLLKAQKRTRRRLIIEQLLLLALRCLMIALVGLLVSRFIGCGDANLGGKPNLHLVLLDDTPSMQDQWKEDGLSKNCFDVARTEILQKKIVKGLTGSRTNDRLVILPLSKLADPAFDIKDVATYENLNDPEKLKKLHEDINELQPSMIHVDMMRGIKAAHQIISDHSDSHATLHIVGDYRTKDWGQPHGETLMKEIIDLAKSRKTELKIRAIDSVYPKRAVQGGFPASRDNVGIVDIRPSTRIAGKNMPVQFSVVLQNFSGAQTEVTLRARDEVTGKDMFDVNFNPPNPIKISPGDRATVTFEKRFTPELKPGDSYFAHVSVRISNPQLQELENDGLLIDNTRHAVVEVRDKVPVLVIDGDTKGRDEGKDSFFISRSLISVPGQSYQVVYGDELVGAGKPATAALERADLNKYPTIFMLNVPSLTPKQATNLENYVKEGGGVAFFLGPLVVASEYNRLLYKDGKGVFPAPLKAPYFPAPTDPALEPKGTDTHQLIIRDEKFSKNDPNNTTYTPIFGPIFEEPKHREPLRDLPIRRYWQVSRGQWKADEGRVFELATLPNDSPAVAFGKEVADITQGAAMTAILNGFPKYQKSLRRHLKAIDDAARPGSEAKAYHLANHILLLRTDKGFSQQKEEFPDLTELWANSDPNVQSVKRQLDNLREEVQFGDPYIVTHTIAEGKGKVVAVMSTAGKDWNDFAGGAASSVLFAPFVWELQNYLSSQGSEANLATGSNFNLTFDAAQFKNAQLKLVRHFHKTSSEGFKKVAHSDQRPDPTSDENVIRFNLGKHNVPGVYITELVDENNADKKPIAVYAHTFNIDTMAEGDLNRVGSDELDQEFGKADGNIKLVPADMPEDQLVGRMNDLSESPWLFLIILLVLVAEQALAVHLSFHLKNNENEAAPAGAAREPKMAA